MLAKNVWHVLRNPGKPNFFARQPGKTREIAWKFGEHPIRGRHGGVEKGGGWKTSRMTPLPKRAFGPPSYGTFSTPPPLGCQCSVFPVQRSTTEQTRSSFGGVQKCSGERVLWYVFLPPYVLHPPISRSNPTSLRMNICGPQEGVFLRMGSFQKRPMDCFRYFRDVSFRRTQEGCGGLGGENPAAFPQARPIFQQPFSLPESAQTLAGIAFRAAGKSGNHFPAAPKFAGKPFQQGISDSHSLLEFSDE